MRQTIRSAAVMILLTVVCSEFSAAKKKEKVPPDPRFATIESISVLPIVDARAGKKADVNLEKLQGGVVKVLKRKHYTADGASISGDAGEIAIEDIEAAKPEYVKKLGPSSERWVMIIFLDDVVSKITFGSTGNAQLSGYLFDKSNGDLIWQAKGVGQAGQGGLMGMTMKGMMKGEALNAAMYSLLASIPKHGK